MHSNGCLPRSRDLVDFLATRLPFAVEEKQALVEARSVLQRAHVLQSVLEMVVGASNDLDATLH